MRTDEYKKSRLIIASIALLFSFFPAWQAQAADLSKTDLQEMSKLEMRFFEHTYAKDDSEARLDRLEKLIFGEVKQGDQEERMESLTASLPKNDLSADPTPSSDASSSASGQPSDSADDSSSQADSQAGDTADYPKVDALEQVLLGKIFKGEPIAKRLDQLEIKAFKQPSGNPDLSERVDKLDEYVQKHMHQNVDALVDPRNIYHYKSPDDDDNVRAPAYTGVPGGGSYASGSGSYGMSPNQMAGTATQNDYWTPPSANSPDAMQVAWLEQRVFGQPGNPAVPLVDRLKRLEATVFPSEPVDPNASIQMQIKILVNAVELMHNSNGSQAGSAGQQQSGGNFPSWPPQNSYAAPNQYSNYSASSGGYGGAQSQGSYPYQGQPPAYNSGSDSNQYQNQPTQQQQQQDDQKHGHPLLKGLAHALMSVGSMAATSVMMGGLNNYGGMGGYGNAGGLGYGGGFMPGYAVPGAARW